MNARRETLLWAAQRASAALLALCVVVHLATMIYAAHSGLGAAQILARTHGKLAWLGFYSVFLLAVVVHVPIGLRTVLSEWLGWRGASRDWVLAVFAAVLAWLGARAILGVFL